MSEGIGYKYSDWRGVAVARTDWIDAQGVVTNVAVIYTRGRRQYTVTFSYEVDRESYHGVFYTFKAHSEGELLTVPYDASNPSRNQYAFRYRRKMWIVAVVVGFFLALTAGMLFMTFNHPK
jgi:hypothetical protein